MPIVRHKPQSVNATGLVLRIDGNSVFSAEIERPDEGGVVVHLTDGWGETFSVTYDPDGCHDCTCGACVTFMGCSHSWAVERVGLIPTDSRYPFRAGKGGGR